MHFDPTVRVAPNYIGYVQEPTHNGDADEHDCDIRPIHLRSNVMLSSARNTAWTATP